MLQSVISYTKHHLAWVWAWVWEALEAEETSAVVAAAAMEEAVDVRLFDETVVTTI